MRTIAGCTAVLAGVMLGAALCARAQDVAPLPQAQTQTDAANPVGALDVRGARIDEVDATHLRIAVDLTVTPAQTVTIESVHLSGLRMNGLPIFAEPLLQPVLLTKGQSCPLPPLYVNVLFRDLTSVAPLREIIDQERMHITGQMVAGLKLPLLERLALHTLQPRISLPIAEDVPVKLAHGGVQREAALGVLSLVEMGLRASSAAGMGIPGLAPGWVQDLGKQADANLLQVRTSFVLKNKDATYPMAVEQLGFRLAAGPVIATAEMQRPWEYDADVLGQIKSGEVKLAQDQTEVQVTGLVGAGADGINASLGHKDFALKAHGKPASNAVIVTEGGHTRVAQLRRDAPDVYTELLVPGASTGFALAPEAVAQQSKWDKVAVFRRLGDKRVEVVTLSAHLEGKGIQFDQPLDDATFGSPIMTPDGVLGMVQDAENGTLITAASLAKKP